MKYLWIDKQYNYICIHSKRNCAEFIFGKATRHFGIFGGIEVFKNYDWWHLTIGVTAIWLYATVKIRWRIKEQDDESRN